MGIFSTGGVGIDLGSANVTISLQNEGVVLREPSYVLTRQEDIEEIQAVGRKAKQMLGRMPGNLYLLSPIRDGAVTDVQTAGALLRGLADKSLGKTRALEKNRLVISSPVGLTHVEQLALEDTARTTGARRCSLLRSPVAAALGADIDFSQPEGRMVVVIGSSVTEVAVLSMGGIAAARSSRTGSLAFDEAIIRHVRREKGLIIGQRTAEDLKVDLGSARASVPDQTVTLRGRDAKTGKPGTAQITAKEIAEAIKRPIEDLLETIREAFENTPAEMAEDILRSGVFLSGGGALLDGLAECLSKTLNLNVSVGENPQDDVAIGCCMVASDERLAQRCADAGCLIEL